MPGLDEDAPFGDDEALGQTDPVMAALEDPKSIHPGYDPDSANAPLNELDTRFGVEGVDFGGIGAVKDEMADIKAQVMDVTADDWQHPGAPFPNSISSEAELEEYKDAVLVPAASEGTALSAAPQEDEPIGAGLS